jgi:predicted dehydrogenase
MKAGVTHYNGDNKVINVGVIGLGQMGILHGAMINASPDSKLKAMCDSNFLLIKMATKLLPNIKFYRDYSVMLREQNLDAVYVCTPTPTHVQIAEDIISLNSSVAIFVEKPLATTASEAETLSELAKNRITMVGFQKRFAGTFRCAKQLISEGAIGGLKFFRSHFYTSENVEKGSGWKFRPKGGGALLEFAPHLLDILLWFFGEPHSTLSISEHTSVRETDDYYHSVFKYNDGLVGYMDVCWAMRNYKPAELMLEVHGDRGTINITEDRILLHLDRSFKKISAGITLIHSADLTPQLPILLAHPENVLADMHFIECVRKQVPTECDFNTGAKVNRLIDKIKAEVI